MTEIVIKLRPIVHEGCVVYATSSTIEDSGVVDTDRMSHEPAIL